MSAVRPDKAKRTVKVAGVKRSAQSPDRGMTEGALYVALSWMLRASRNARSIGTWTPVLVGAFGVRVAWAPRNSVGMVSQDFDLLRVAASVGYANAWRALLPKEKVARATMVCAVPMSMVGTAKAAEASVGARIGRT